VSLIIEIEAEEEAAGAQVAAAEVAEAEVTGKCNVFIAGAEILYTM